MSEKIEIVITDSAGVQVVERTIGELRVGDRIAGGWRPHPVFERYETDELHGEMFRMVFFGGHKGGWVSWDEKIAVIVFDPKVDS